MTKKLGIITAVISVIALCISLVTFAQVKTASNTGDQDARDVQYVLYLGTNDKDTNEPVFQPDEAKEKAEEILLEHFGGYTIQEADGGWVGDDKVYTEHTLVIYLSDTDADSVHSAADDMIKTFNQSSILIQENSTSTEFYDGGQQ